MVEGMICGREFDFDGQVQGRRTDIAARRSRIVYDIEKASVDRQHMQRNASVKARQRRGRHMSRNTSGLQAIYDI